MSLKFLSATKKRDFGSIVAKYKCDCGKISYHVKYRVDNGTISSCGCSRRKEDRHKFIQQSLGDYKYRAKLRGWAFTLTKSQFFTLVKKTCCYCKKFRNELKVSGLDRIDSTKGYVLSNVRPCCKVCNRAKGTLSLKEFLNWIQDLKGSDL